jgi:hypothetical protein
MSPYFTEVGFAIFGEKCSERGFFQKRAMILLLRRQEGIYLPAVLVDYVGQVMKGEMRYRWKYKRRRIASVS